MNACLVISYYYSVNSDVLFMGVVTMLVLTECGVVLCRSIVIPGILQEVLKGQRCSDLTINLFGE